MDILSFGSLYESCQRLNKRENYMRAWTAFVAAQCDKKSLEEFTQHWLEQDEKQTNGAEEFMKRFPNGF